MPRGRTMLSTNLIHYKCSTCKTVFSGIPEDLCPFCHTDHHLEKFFKAKRKNKFTKIEEQDYEFRDTDYHISITKEK